MEKQRAIPTERQRDIEKARLTVKREGEMETWWNGEIEIKRFKKQKAAEIKKQIVWDMERRRNKESQI
jgi:hypothetical protein